MGEELARLGPAGFNPTATNALVVEAVGWTAALRERLLALAGRPMLAFAPGLPKAERAPQARGAAPYLTEITYEVSADDWHDWPALARPWRMGPGGVAMAARAIAGLSDREVVSEICGKLKQAARELGAEADVTRIAALEAAARALCPEADATADEAADPGAKAEGAAGARAAGPPSDEPETEADDDPPKRPPDG
jgi:hypothetical protein